MPVHLNETIKPDIHDGFVELFQEKYLFIKINKINF